MKIRLCAVLAGASLAALLASPALAKHPKHVRANRTAHAVHRSEAGRRYAQSYYDYRSSSMVREEFIGAPHRAWREAPHDGHFDRYDGYRDGRGGLVVENLRGDFTGGVGYGADGNAASFVDGYGQRHFFVGNCRGMLHGPGGFGPPPRAGQGFRRGF